MKPVIPPPPPGPHPLHYHPLPDHTQLPDREGGLPLRPPSGPPPDHTLLPDKDGKFVRNSFEFWQNHLLTDSLLPLLDQLFPEGDYFIGEDCGIYWQLADPPERGVKAPDWFLVPEVPRLLDGQMRRSFVSWQEAVNPLVILEYASGDGTEERDQTPNEGKFWVFERRVRSPFYGIYEPNSGGLEFYVLSARRYARAQPNEFGRFPIQTLGVELGVWQGVFAGYQMSWLRWWDQRGILLPTGLEKAERLAAKLRELGIDPNTV
jgi:Uma2 family endonuclease